MSQNTQFYTGFGKFGSMGVLPVYAGTGINVPMNWQIPQILGNYVQINYCDGIRMPALMVNFSPFDQSLGLFNDASGGLLYYLLERTSGVTHDTISLGTVEFWDGRLNYQIGGAKLESLTLATSRGDQLRVASAFVGTSLTLSEVAPTWADFNANARIIAYDWINFSGALANIVASFSLTYSNNHTPDPSLNGTWWPSQVNASTATASFSITTQAADYGSAGQNIPYNGPLANGANSTLLCSPPSFPYGSGYGAGNVSFQLRTGPLLNQTPHNGAATAPRNMKSFAYSILGSTSRWTSASSNPLITKVSGGF